MKIENFDKKFIIIYINILRLLNIKLIKMKKYINIKRFRIKR